MASDRHIAERFQQLPSSVPNSPEDPFRRDLERAPSKQDVPHRFAGRITVDGPAQTWLRDFHFAAISSLAAAHCYSIYAGMDVNTGGNPMTDRLGVLGRNTYKRDTYVSFDLRLARTLRLSDQLVVTQLSPSG